MKTVITQKLDALKLDYTVKSHRQAVYTSRAAARERGVRLYQIVKTMPLADQNDRMVVVDISCGDPRAGLELTRDDIGILLEGAKITQITK